MKKVLPGPQPYKCHQFLFKQSVFQSGGVYSESLVSPSASEGSFFRSEDACCREVHVPQTDCCSADDIAEAISGYDHLSQKGNVMCGKKHGIGQRAGMLGPWIVSRVCCRKAARSGQVR